MHEETDKRAPVTHLSTVEARSGSRTTVTRHILLISLLLVVAAFIIALATGFFETARTGADEVNGGNSNTNMAR